MSTATKTAKPNTTTTTKNPEPKTIPMSTALDRLKAQAGELVNPADMPPDDVFDAVANSGKYLPRLQMFGGNSDAVKSGKIGMAHYALVTGKDQYQDLGTEVDCIPLWWRPKAMDVGGEEVISVHDHTDPEFRRIQEASNEPDSGCMFGPEFLVWLPSAKKFATLFMSSKTARREAPTIRERLLKPTTLGTEFIKTKRYSWHGIVAKPCSTPFDMPEDDRIEEQVELFKNPPKVEVERVAESAATTRPR